MIIGLYPMQSRENHDADSTPVRLPINQDEGIKIVLTWFLNLVMQLEVPQQSGPEPYQRIESRNAHRNGYKEQSLKTRIGDITLRMPQFRGISF